MHPGADGARDGLPGRDEPGRHRLFIAVLLTAEVRGRADRARRALAAHADRFRWVAPEHMHLTLQFLGDITSAEVHRTVDAARDVGASAAPFAIAFAGLGAFPSPAAPRVVWVGVAAGADRLIVLAEALRRALRTRRVPCDDRPFAPHVTLARVRGSGRPPDLRPLSETFGGIALGGQPVTEMAVVKSVLGPSGPTHTVVASSRLNGDPGGSEGP